MLILWGAVIERGFPAQSWLTFRQALSLGGNVRKGEHGTTVVYADLFGSRSEATGLGRRTERYSSRARPPGLSR
jgi:antirestriction protein ArdC